MNSDGGTSLTLGPDWGELLRRLHPGIVMVIGSPGMGKSRLARFLAEHLNRDGRSVGLLCADMGQPSLGVPTCLALALDPPWTDPATLWFAGDTTPVGHLLQTVVGTVRLAERARQEQVQFLLIDTSGLVQGARGRLLKYHKAVAVGATQIVAIQQTAELEPLLALLTGPCPTCHRLAPVPAARDRSLAERRQYREARFRTHLAGGNVVVFPAERVLSSDWSTGAALDGETLIPGTVAGLLDEQGYCLGLGRIEEVNPNQLAVYTAWPRPEAVARVQVGKVRLGRDGNELG
jgi:polynucleotide 5'-hydroxyl-kinase GRC3/NOL9